MSGERRNLVLVLLATIVLGSGLGVSAAAASSGENGRIVYVGYRWYSSRGHIFSVRPDGTDNRRLTGPSQVASPAYSPDGRSILFVRYTTTLRAEIWLMGRFGANKTRLATGPGDSAQPAWSPDGSEFVFVKPGAGDHQLFVYTFATGKIRQLTVATGENGPYSSQPDWAPAGNELSSYGPASSALNTSSYGTCIQCGPTARGSGG